MHSILPSSPDLERLADLLGRSLARVEERIKAQLASELPPVQALSRQVERYHGKMVRPMVAMLSGLAVDASASVEPDEAHVSEEHVVVAAVCEMVHLATLVHDDVLDEAEVRRQGPTINSLHGNESAVILGDYLFSAAFNLCAGLDAQAVSMLIARVGMTLCEGELLQLHHRGNFSLDERTYFAIVRRKTASLIAASCRLGARFGGADEATQARLETLGEALGIAFQVQDDLLDLTGEQSVVGKSLGKDLEKGKLTLPIIHHLASATPEQRARTLLLLEGAPAGHEGTAALRRALESTGSVAHARRTAERYVAAAKEAIAPLHESVAKTMLMQLADAIVTRAY
ncbi:MAG: polyprenyl synthetase family protein [Phycisphaerales bacterium]